MLRVTVIFVIQLQKLDEHFLHLTFQLLAKRKENTYCKYCTVLLQFIYLLLNCLFRNLALLII